MMKLFFTKLRVSSLIMILMFFMVSTIKGQVSVGLTEIQSRNQDGNRCYELSLTNQGAKALALAGQNYRFYYDSEFAKLTESSVKTLLPTQYTPMALVQNFHNVDATNFGSLPYDSKLGFINLATDLNLHGKNALSLAVGKSVTVASLCFDVASGHDLSINWAEENLTHTYATAFVELSLIDDAGLTNKAAVTKFHVTKDTKPEPQTGALFGTKTFPNPFNDKFTINFDAPLSSDATVSISNVFGVQLRSQKVEKGASNMIIVGNDLPEGTLLIEININDGQKSIVKAIKLK